MPRVLALIVLILAALDARGQVPVNSLPDRLDDARATYMANDVEKADALSRAVRDDAEVVGDTIVVAHATALLGRIRLRQERLADARSELERARDAFRLLGERRHELEITLVLGRALSLLGDPLPDGELTRAIHELETIDMPREALLANYSQALAVLRQQDASRPLLARALARLTPRDRFGAACSLWQSAGDRAFNDADYVPAHEHLTLALACYTDIGRQADAGRVLVSLGRVQRAHGQLHTAMDYYVRAAAAQKAVGDVPAWLQSLNAQAVTHDRLGQFTQAEALYRQALAEARRAKLLRYEIFLQGNLGGSLLSAGRIEPALRELTAVVDRETTTEVRAVRHRQIADAYAALGNVDAALRHAASARDLLPDPTFDDRVNALTQHASLLAMRGDLAGARRDLAEARSLVEGARARALDDDAARRGFGDLHQGVFAASIDIAMREGDAPGALDIAEQARSRALLDLMRGREAGRPDEDDADQAYRPLRVEQMQELARRLDTTLLVYWVQPRATLVWVVTGTGVHGRRLPIGEQELRRLIRRAAGAGDVAGTINAALLAGPDLRPWRTLHRAVVAPIAAHLPIRRGARVTVVPHGPLLHMPFAGLLDSHGRYLVERYTLHYAPSLAVLAAALPDARATPRPRRALVLGDPAPLPRRAGMSLPPPLPHARREARAVARHFPAGAVLSVGGAATERHLRSLVSDYSWLHVATHARVSEEVTAPSYLLLARGDGGPADDGLLTADEVKALRLDGATVVLSACGTALGRVTGEGTLGFTRSFLAAGARSVVATTWEIPDVSGTRTMEAFYRAIAGDRGIAAALRTAQLEQLRDLRAGRVTVRTGSQVVKLPATPLLWAGYVAVGTP